MGQLMCDNCIVLQRHIKRIEKKLITEQKKAAAYHELLVTIISGAAGKTAGLSIQREVRQKCKKL